MGAASTTHGIVRLPPRGAKVVGGKGWRPNVGLKAGKYQTINVRV